MKTQVAIIGAGPAGLFLSEMLSQYGIDSIVVDKKSRTHILSRVRAGVLEENTAAYLRAFGLTHNLDKVAQPHTGFKVVWDNDHSLLVDLLKHTQQHLMVYGQSNLQQDLFSAADKRNARIFTEITHLQLNGIESNAPSVIFQLNGEQVCLNCDVIIGCDGFYGESRKVMKTYSRVFEKSYPFHWLGILSKTPPLSHITYAYHRDGFALASARNTKLSRYYIQVPTNSRIMDWDDDRFWEALKARYPKEIADKIITGPSVEKSIIAHRYSILKNPQHGRLYLAGDAAHILPPTGAKGLNLAIHDVYYLACALNDFYHHKKTNLLVHYATNTFKRTAHAWRIATFMTHMLHAFPEENHDAQQFIFERLRLSEAMQMAFVNQYHLLDVREQMERLCDMKSVDVSGGPFET